MSSGTRVPPLPVNSNVVRSASRSMQRWPSALCGFSPNAGLEMQTVELPQLGVLARPRPRCQSRYSPRPATPPAGHAGAPGSGRTSRAAGAPGLSRAGRATPSRPKLQSARSPARTTHRPTCRRRRSPRAATPRRHAATARWPRPCKAGDLRAPTACAAGRWWRARLVLRAHATLIAERSACHCSKA